MGLLEKVKKFFYDEEFEEDEDEEEVEQTEQVRKPTKVHRKERSTRIEQKEEDISERELFKAERTFNFPMDIDGEDEEIIKEPQEETKSIVEEERFIPLRRYNEEVRESAYAGIRSYAAYEPSVRVEEKREEKKFKPTPIISPIYGVLDKNYKKADTVQKKIETYDTEKKLDYDIVRKKAYGDLYEEEKDEQKGIFFNLDDKKTGSSSNEDDVKIIYNDVTFDEEEIPDESISEDQLEKVTVEIPNIIEDTNENIEFEVENSQMEENEQEDEDKILSESNEDDLFNLIDNMYNSEDDTEEDE